jgi:alpha-tubulin suppressor-like RCC1 family protein
LSNVVAVASGGYHNLAIRADGTVAAWGQNGYGQTVVPTDLSNAVAVACGRYHSLALRADGTVVAWGQNNYGATNVPAGLNNVVAVACGGHFSLALRGNSPPMTQVTVTSSTMGTNGFSLSLPTQCGRVFALEYKKSLADTNWTPLPLVAGTGTNVWLTDSTATNSQRSYRVRRW